MFMSKAINYSYLLFDTLREYFSVRSDGTISWLYKFCLACLYPLQSKFNTYDTFRIERTYVAYCNYTKGQLTNLLNKLFPSTTTDLFSITQRTSKQVFMAGIDTGTNIGYTTTYSKGYTEVTTTYLYGFPYIGYTDAIINVPSDIYDNILSAVEAIVNQIKLTGLTIIYNRI